MPDQTYIAFIHVPKTGGSSLYHPSLPICSHAVGHGRVSDYADRGHPHSFLTMMRDPLVTALSLYYDMRKNGQYQNVTPQQFLQDEPIRLYAYYFEGMPVSAFDVVGATDDMERTVALINTVYGSSVPVRHLNLNPHARYNIDCDRDAFARKYAQDYDIYYEGAERYQTLCRLHLGDEAVCSQGESVIAP